MQHILMLFFYFIYVCMKLTTDECARGMFKTKEQANIHHCRNPTVIKNLC